MHYTKTPVHCTVHCSEHQLNHIFKTAHCKILLMTRSYGHLIICAYTYNYTIFVTWKCRGIYTYIHIYIYNCVRLFITLNLAKSIYSTCCKYYWVKTAPCCNYKTSSCLILFKRWRIPGTWVKGWAHLPSKPWAVVELHLDVTTQRYVLSQHDLSVGLPTSQLIDLRGVNRSVSQTYHKWQSLKEKWIE